jgi:hypothetical protein
MNVVHFTDGATDRLTCIRFQGRLFRPARRRDRRIPRWLRPSRSGRHRLIPPQTHAAALLVTAAGALTLDSLWTARSGHSIGRSTLRLAVIRIVIDELTGK